MVNSVDDPLARFLYAILKQKNLKDIDWNRVANDPVLLEAVPNGHAARMRYSRYRSTVEKAMEAGGSSKKSRVSDKGRITKPKRDSRSSSSSIIKSESVSNITCLAQFSPASIASSHFTSDSLDDYSGARFPTPCSDDMSLLVPPQTTESDNFPPPGSQFLDATTHDPTSPNFAAFDNALNELGIQNNGFDFSSQTLMGSADWMGRYGDSHGC